MSEFEKGTRYWWLNEESQQVLNRGYLLKGETVEQAVDRITTAASKILYKPHLQPIFKEIIEKGWMSLSSPIWSNMGTGRGLPISCFNVHVPDSIEDITKKLGEVIIQTKIGGGTSGYFGELRGRGAAVTDNGESSGAVSFMKLFDTTMDTISQGGIRRGSFAAYLDIDHPDIEEFLQIRDIGNPLQNLFYGVTVPDWWMQEMIEGDTNKRELWAKVLNSRQEKGLPYIFYTDNVNRGKPEVYKDLDLTINASNLCIVGSDRVVSTKGYLTAKELHELDELLTLFNGEEPVEASKMNLIEENVDVYKMTLDNGMSQTVTHYHGIPKYVNGKIVRTPLSEMNVGDRVAIQTKKGLFGTKSMEDEAYLLGLYQSDGTQNKGKVMIDVWEDDFDILDEVYNSLDRVYSKYDLLSYNISNQTGVTSGFRRGETPKFVDCSIGHSKVKKKRIASSYLNRILGFEKGIVPDWIWESDEKTQWKYVKGLLIGDGTVFKSNSHGNPTQLNYSSIDRKFLEDLQLIFQNLGLQTSIRILREGGETLLPDGKGGEKMYDTEDCWRLIVGNKPNLLEIEDNTGFLSRKGVHIEDREYRDNTKKAYKVVSIEHVGKEDVYCPTVYNDEHIFVTNGMKTFNCSEIALPSSKEESFVCCLSSMNLELYDEWKDTEAVKYAIYFLDAVMQEFINKTKGKEYLEAARNFAKRHRALGLGVMGWHSFLQKNMIPFESLKAKQLSSSIFKQIEKETKEASLELAEIYGHAPIFSEVSKDFKGKKYRNTTTMAIAPTTSSSSILGQVSPGIEPFSSNYYKAGLAKGNFIRKNKHLTALLEKKGKNDSTTWRSIMMKQGSVQHLNFLTDEEKDVFKTFKEVSQYEIILQASIRQKFIDQSQSLNLNIPPDMPVKEVNKLLIEAWTLGVKSLYYQRSQSVSKELLSNLITCISCEG